MDSNRRHQLSENALAKWFKKQHEEWISPNNGLLSTLVIVVLLVLCVVLLAHRYMERQRAAVWGTYQSALTAENPVAELEVLAETAKEPVLSQARLTLGQMLLGENCVKVSTGSSADTTEGENRDSDNRDSEKTVIEPLEKALEQFRALENASVVALRQQARFGLAQTLETLAAARSGNDLAEAEKVYQEIVSQWPESFYGRQAAKQLLLLSQPSTKKFLEQVLARAANKANALPKAEDFKVEIDTKDPFANGPASIDAAKVLGESTPESEKAAESPSDAPVETKPAENPPAENAPTEEQK